MCVCVCVQQKTEAEPGFCPEMNSAAAAVRAARCRQREGTEAARAKGRGGREKRATEEANVTNEEEEEKFQVGKNPTKLNK